MLALVVTVDPAELELVADALWSLGVVAIEERRGGNGVEVELWTSLGDDRIAVETALQDLAGRWRLVEVDEGVADTWRQHAVPTWVDDGLVIVPAWQDAVVQPDDDVLVVSIEPGATFGAGDHPTTVLSLRALRRLLPVSDGARPDVSVLDVGCGSGVLSVAAVMMGATAAHGIDISLASIAITTANAQANGVSAAVTVSTEPLSAVQGTYDIVVANILAPVLIDLSADLLRVMAADGVLIISGVLTTRFDHVVQALAPLRVTQVDELDGWAAVTLRR